ALRSSGTRSIWPTEPSKYLRSETMTSSQRPRSLRSWTSCAFTTVKSPDIFDLTKRFWYAGSIDCDTPQMLEIVAVGAMAIVLELRIPTVRTRSLRLAQSSVELSSMSTLGRASFSKRTESIGRMPFDQSEP